MSTAKKLASGGFKKMVNKPPKNPVLLTMTPDAAYEALTFKEDALQRPVSVNTVRSYADQMAKGLWKLAADPVAFDVEGGVQNGQHRLHAVIESGKSVPMWCFFGQSPDLFDVYDAGKKRTAGDIFSINGEVNPNQAASVTKSVYRYLTATKTPHPSITENRDFDIKVSSEAYEYYKALGPSRVQQALTVYYKISAERLNNPGPITAIHLLCNEIDEELSAEFFKGLASGANLGPRSVVKKLRDTFMRAHGTIMPITSMALTIRAWNAVRTKRRGLNVSPVGKWSELPKLV